MTDPTLHGYIDKWLAARPARHQAQPFLPAPRRDALLIFGALEHELITATYGISDPQVAAAKLNWWGEELAGATVSGGRHPLIKALFADDDIRAIDPALWLAPVSAGLVRQDQSTAPDFATQLERTQAFHGAIAALETRITFGADGDPTRAGRFASLDYLLQAISVVEENVSVERLPLPMDRLARHDLDRNTLAKDSPQRRAAMAEHLQDILREWRSAWRLSGPVSLFRGLDARLGQRWLRRAVRNDHPLARLRHEQKHQTGMSTLRMAWAAARAARGAQVD